MGRFTIYQQCEIKHIRDWLGVVTAYPPPPFLVIQQPLRALDENPIYLENISCSMKSVHPSPIRWGLMKVEYAVAVTVIL